MSASPPSPPPGDARPAPGPTARPVVYHVARARHRRWPAVLLAVAALPAVVAGQVAVGLSDPDRSGPATVARPAGTPTAPAVPSTASGATAVPEPEPTGPVPPPGDAPPQGPTAAPELLPAPSAVPEDLVAVPEVTVRFAAGAVLDEEGRRVLGPVGEVLSAPDATGVVVLGSAEPGPDEAAALRLAQERADAVRQALLDAGAAQQLVRTRAVVDAAVGRAVVVSPEVP